MLMIRLQRTGRRNIPTYRLIVVEKHAPARGGKAQEYLGHYLPARDPSVFEFNRDRVGHWLTVGAQPSDTAARLLTRAGMKGLEKFVRRYTKKKKKGEESAGDTATTAAPVEQVKTEEKGKEKEKPVGDKGEKAA